MNKNLISDDDATIQFTMRLDPEIHRWITQYAKEQHRSINSMIGVLLRSAQESIQRSPASTGVHAPYYQLRDTLDYEQQNMLDKLLVDLRRNDLFTAPKNST